MNAVDITIKILENKITATYDKIYEFQSQSVQVAIDEAHDAKKTPQSTAAEKLAKLVITPHSHFK